MAAGTKSISGRRIHLPRAKRDPRGLLRVLMRIGPGEIQDRRAWSRPSSATCEEPRIDAALPVPGSPAYLQPEGDWPLSRASGGLAVGAERPGACREQGGQDDPHKADKTESWFFAHNNAQGKNPQENSDPAPRRRRRENSDPHRQQTDEQ